MIAPVLYVIVVRPAYFAKGMDSESSASCSKFLVDLEKESDSDSVDRVTLYLLMTQSNDIELDVPTFRTALDSFPFGVTTHHQPRISFGCQ